MNRDDYISVAFGGVLALLFLCSVAFAADKPPTMDCYAIRNAVAEHGRVKAIKWAREQGYSWAQINEARKCLR